MVRLPGNEKQTYRLNSKASNVTIRFDLGHDLDLGFSRSNMEFAISQPKVVRLPRNEKQTYRSNSRPQMWPMGLTLTIILTFEILRSNMTSVCKIIGRPRRPINRPGDLEVRLGGPLGDQIFLSPKDIKVFHDALFCLKSISNTIVCNPQKKNILKSMCQQCNDLKLTLILNGPPNIDRTTQSATMVGPLDQPWFLPILHTVTLTFDHTHDLDHEFSWSNFEIDVSQNGRADWHCTKGVAVGHSWPWPWPFGD